MKKKMEVGVIGLGKFGFQFGTTLTELGHKVIGLDSDPERLRLAQDAFSQVYQANATDKSALIQLGFQDLDTVAVSVGRSMETSILVTLNLQEMGIRNIIVKAISPAHRKVLRRIGAHQVIQPEADVATLSAHRLSNPGLLDYLPISGGMLVQEFTVDDWAGKSLIDLNLRKDSGVLVAAIRGASDAGYTFVPDPRTPFVKGDVVLILGNQSAVAELKT